jgi:hypothetical protein
VTSYQYTFAETPPRVAQAKWLATKDQSSAVVVHLSANEKSNLLYVVRSTPSFVDNLQDEEAWSQHRGTASKTRVQGRY